MATSKIFSTYETTLTPTLTIATLGNGAGRICTVIDNTATRAGMAMAFLSATMGSTAATANTPIKLYLIRHSNAATNIADNGLGAADAAVSVEPTQAECLGSIIVGTTVSVTYEKSFLAYDLSAKYSFVVWNGTGQALAATAATHQFQVIPVVPEAQ